MARSSKSWNHARRDLFEHPGFLGASLGLPVLAAKVLEDGLLAKRTGKISQRTTTHDRLGSPEILTRIPAYNRDAEKI
jgi:hypothetical protein